jgi:hypothetical protein
LGENIPDEKVSVDVAADGSEGRDDDDELGQVPVGLEVLKPAAFDLNQLLAREVDDEDRKAR